MLEKIKNWFSSESNKKLLFGVVSVSLIFGVFLINLHCNNEALLNANTQLSNELAEKDSLRRILLVNNQWLSERYAFQKEDLNRLVKNNEAISKYLKDRNAKILVLTNSVTSFKLENQSLLGTLRENNLGEYAEFDSTNQYYSISATARLKPTPVLNILSLGILDSTSVALIQEGPYLKGFITHSNPYISDISGEFYKELKSWNVTDSGFRVEWYWAVILFFGGLFSGLIL